MKLEIIVLKKNGNYYAAMVDVRKRVRRWDETKDFDADYTVVPWNEQWVKFDRLPTRAYTKQRTIRRLAGFCLRDESLESTERPKMVGLDFFEEEGDFGELEPTKNEDLRYLYERHYVDEVVPPVLVDVDFVLLDEDCEPARKEIACKTDFPYNLDFHPATWHKYPTTINSHDAFLYVVAEVMKYVDGDDRFDVKNYTNIGSFDVTARLVLPNPEEHEVSVVKGRGKRQRTVRERRVRGNVAVKIIDVYSNNYSNRPVGADVIGTIRGNTYDEAFGQVLAKIDEYKAIIDASKFSLCPHCNGRGALRPDGSRV